MLALERLQVIVPALAAADPLRNNLDPAAVLDIGRRLIAGMVDSLGPAGPRGPLDTGTGQGFRHWYRRRRWYRPQALTLVPAGAWGPVPVRG